MRFFFLLLGTCFALASPGQTRRLTFQIIATTDVHGNYFPRDYINRTEGEGSLARICGYVEEQRARYGREHVVLLDAGDILQGQPTAYFYNYIDTTDTHVCAAALNYMRYDAACIGNHDVETGHSVYDRWAAQLDMPLLGANVVSTATGKPYLKPYTIIKRDGVRFAVLGLLTPHIPDWLPETLWQGLAFEDMAATARKYMPEMRRQADVVIGLFHSGMGTEQDTAQGAENATLQVARSVPGFDFIFFGHDHREALRHVVNTAGDTVVILNPGANARRVAQATLRVAKRHGRVVSKHLAANLVDICQRQPDAAFLDTFWREQDMVQRFADEVIATNPTPLSSRPAFFGPSPFVDYIHRLQLRLTHADISFAAPLSLDTEIPAGSVRVSDLFSLYKYENTLCIMRLTGQEVKDYLEYSYAGWTNIMTTPADHMLRFDRDRLNAPERWQRLEVSSYNFDSAAGLLYTVDLTKPRGEKVVISSLADGSTFSPDSTYLVAVNSYRAGGGGNLLTYGAGIPRDSLTSRIVWRSDRDLRHYMLEELRSQGVLQAEALNQWRFIPEPWAQEAAQRDYKILFE